MCCVRRQSAAPEVRSSSWDRDRQTREKTAAQARSRRRIFASIGGDSRGAVSLTTRLVNLALEQVFPANRPSVGSATLSFSGTLVLRDLLLHDTGPLARQPLVM